MQLRQAAAIFLTSAVVLTQLSGCAAVTPDKGVESSDDVTVVTEETNANSTAANADTVTVCGEQYDVSETPAEQVEQEEIPLTTEELHALFKKEYDTERYAKSNLYADQYKDFYLKLPAREIGTQVDANVYSYIELAVKGAEYEGKVLPADGFEQYVAWREAYMPDNSQTGTGETGSTEIKGIPDENTEEPFDGNDDPSLIDKDSQNVYEGAVVEREVTEAGSGKDLIESEYVTPSYEIVG